MLRSVGFQPLEFGTNLKQVGFYQEVFGIMLQDFI